MSEILNLAKGFEAKSKQQAIDTEAALKLAFKLHEASISAALSSSEKTIKSAIDAQRASMQRMILRTWIWVAVCLITLLCLAWGILKYQGGLIVDNLQVLNVQKQTLAQLESQTWGLSLREDPNGRFIVLPKGTHAITGWKTGEQETVKIEH